MFLALLLYLCCFLVYLELSPGLGNVWIRKNADGDRQLSLGGLWNVFRYPFQNPDMWLPPHWDINPWIGCLIALAV
jgi:hypothetical protein